LAQKEKRTKVIAFPMLWALLIAGVGVILLLSNFGLLGNFNVVALLPLFLVIAGAQILLRGDFIPNADTRDFGITRGSVESATLEISSGAVDVDIIALQREGRLIAGQFAVNSRPMLDVRDTYAHLKLMRSKTPWWSYADWKIALAQDLPWQILVSTHLGQATLDLSQVIVHDVVVGTGIGDIRLVCPKEAFNPLFLRSTFGNVHILTPLGYRAKIVVRQSRLFTVTFDPQRYDNPQQGVYLAHVEDESAPIIEIQVSGTFGDAYLT
jgi:hypothetical protein